jgi:hypothetical protein
MERCRGLCSGREIMYATLSKCGNELCLGPLRNIQSVGVTKIEPKSVPEGIRGISTPDVHGSYVLLLSLVCNWGIIVPVGVARTSQEQRWCEVRLFDIVNTPILPLTLEHWRDAYYIVLVSVSHDDDGGDHI